MDTTDIAKLAVFVSAIAVVVSAIAALVSFFNFKATNAKLKLDLYDRRFKIYEDILALYQTIHRPWDCDKVHLLELSMIRSFRESIFLFEPEDGVYDVISKIQQANARNSGYYKHIDENPHDRDTKLELHNSALTARQEFDNLILELEGKLAKYLDFRKIHGW